MLSGYHYLLQIVTVQQRAISCLLHLCTNLQKLLFEKERICVPDERLQGESPSPRLASADILDEAGDLEPLSARDRIEVLRLETTRYWKCVAPALNAPGVSQNFAENAGKKVLRSPDDLYIDLNLNPQDQQNLADIFRLLCMVIEESLTEQIPPLFRTSDAIKSSSLQSLLGTSESLTVMILGRDLLRGDTPRELYEAQLAYINYNNGMLSSQLKPAQQRCEWDHRYYRNKMMFNLINFFCSPL